MDGSAVAVDQGEVPTRLRPAVEHQRVFALHQSLLEEARHEVVVQAAVVVQLALPGVGHESRTPPTLLVHRQRPGRGVTCNVSIKCVNMMG